MKSHSQNEKNVMQVTIIHNTNIISNNYHVWKQQLHNNCETLVVEKWQFSGNSQSEASI